VKPILQICQPILQVAFRMNDSVFDNAAGKVKKKRSPRFGRRHVLAGLGGAAGTAATGLAYSRLASPALAQSMAHIVVVGGGFGGATAARAIQRQAPHVKVSLIAPADIYTACPFSNLVISGSRPLKAQEFSYEALSKIGISVIKGWVETVDPLSRTLSLRGGHKLSYDRLILSPGIDFDYDALDGYSPEAAKLLPHAWKAGAQTLLLRDQIRAMPETGRVVISVPPAPFRCPPGPYERASLIAHYLKTYKPRAKLLILDAQETFSKQALFQAAWAQHYNDIITWRGGSDDGAVQRVDAKTKRVFTDFDEITADVINIIPPQKAGRIAQQAGVTNASGWCPVNAQSFASSLQDNIYVIGDATLAAPMPKSAFSANLQARLCARQVLRDLADLPATPTLLSNSCYSFTSPEQAISITGVYKNNKNVLESVAGSGGISPLIADKFAREAEADHARDWFETLTHQAFGA